MQVKICGLSNYADAKLAIDLGADALGFVMGGKILPVEIEPLAQHVRQWIGKIPSRIDTFVVTHFKDIREILELAEYVNSSGIQVSESLSVEHLKQLRDLTDKKIIKTIPVGQSDSLEYLQVIEKYCDFLLLDSMANGYIGGTGSVNDWQKCRMLIRHAKKPVYLAGGLTCENVSEARRICDPQGVDVSTGVSTYSPENLRKDRKDPRLIGAFIQSVKTGEGI